MIGKTKSKILVRAKSIYQTVRVRVCNIDRRKHSTTNTSTRIKRLKESKQGRMADALALGGDEGRDKLR